MAFLARTTMAIGLLSIGYTLGLFRTSSLPSSSSSSSSSSAPLSSGLVPLQLQTGTNFNCTTLNLNRESVPVAYKDLLQFKRQCTKPIPEGQIYETILNRIWDGVSPYSGFPSPATAVHLLPLSSKPRGWGSTTPVFQDLISTVRPKTIIELGTFLGASALHMAQITRNLSLPSTLILCIDDFRSWPGARRLLRRDLPVPYQGDALLLHQFMLAVQNANESDRVLPFPFSTSSALVALCEWGIYGDLIEVDAGHDFHSAWSDINLAWAVLRPGGVLFGHDYFTKADNMGVRRAVTLFAKVNGLAVRPHGQHWILSPKPRPSAL
ncbi:putative S-adenosyl-L-methionine-dependent methyltransferase [Dioscorea sansibarensis]